MKKYLVFAFLIALLMMVSCGESVQEQAEAYAADFVQKVNSNMVDSVHAMYPGAADVEAFATELKADSMSVDPDNMTGGFRVTLADGKWFVLTGSDKASFQVVASRGLFAYPSDLIDFATQTGWVKPDMDDQAMRKALADTAFCDYLYDKTIEQLKKNVKAEVDYGHSDIQSMTEVKSAIAAKVTNNGTRELNGEDYSVTIGSDMASPVVVKGTNISPKTSGFVRGRLPAEGMARQAYYATLNLKPKATSKTELVYRYYDVTGGEYEEYLKTK